jgi:hypothetical protein
LFAVGRILPLPTNSRSFDSGAQKQRTSAQDDNSLGVVTALAKSEERRAKGEKRKAKSERRKANGEEQEHEQTATIAADPTLSLNAGEEDGAAVLCVGMRRSKLTADS